MAIPLSSRRANRRPRPRRNSLDPSATRGLSQLGDLGLGELSLSSQLMCAAILEAWRLLRTEVAPPEEVTGECEEAAEAEAEAEDEEVISALENLSRMMRMRTARRHSLPATLPDTSTDQEVGVTIYLLLSIYLDIY